MKETWACCATLDDASWIVDLSARVQEALTASGSRQLIGPLLLEETVSSIRGGTAFVLQTQEKRLGSVLVEPLEGVRLVQWGLSSEAGPWWYLHSLMLEPEEQGKGLGGVFLEEVKRLMAPRLGHDRVGLLGRKWETARFLPTRRLYWPRHLSRGGL